MKKRQIKIAVLVPQLPEDAVLLACRGMMEEAKKQQISIHFFICSYINTERNSYIIGEKTIFSLPCLADYHGFLLLGSFHDPYGIMSDLKEHIMTESNAPIVTVNYIDSSCTSVTINHSKAMYELTRHFIDIHHFKHFAYLTGPMDEEDSCLSYHGFLDAIKEAGDQVSSPKIYYNFSSSLNVSKAADSFLECKIRPQVILCSDNTNALFIYDELLRRGLKIPEDISIACLSGVSQEYKSTLLTSVTGDCKQMGSRAVNTLIDSLTGIPTEKLIEIPFEISIGRSCSCKITNWNRNIDWMLFNNIQSDILKSKMLFIWDGLCEFTDLKEAIYHFAPYLLHLHYIKTCFVCLCNESEQQLSQAKYHETYTPHMILRAIINPGTSPMFCHKEFLKENLLPPEFLSELKTSTLSFFPLHYRNHCLGYLALDIAKPLNYSFLLRECLAALSLSLELISQKKSSPELGNITFLTSDYLSNMDNLLGFEKKSAMLYQELYQEKVSCYMYMIALDRLEKTDSSSSYIQRDQLIAALSEGLLKVTTPDMLCARITGSCFCILWGRVSKDRCDALEASILDEFKSISKRLNHLPVSFLTASVYAENASEITLSEMMDHAYAQLKEQRL